MQKISVVLSVNRINQQLNAGTSGRLLQQRVFPCVGFHVTNSYIVNLTYFMPSIQASYIFHKNEKRIKLQFENYGVLNKLVKSLPGARWSKTYKSWHIPHDSVLYKRFKNNLPEGCTLIEVKKSGGLQKLSNKNITICACKSFFK